MEPKTKKNRRATSRYPALEKKFTGLRRQEYLDYDYISKLNDEEKDFLNRFTEEDLHANVKHKGEVFHDTKEKRKLIYSKNNSRNRDIYSEAKVKKRIIDVDPSLTDRISTVKYGTPEEIWNRLLDEQLEEKLLDEYEQTQHSRKTSRKLK